MTIRRIVPNAESNQPGQSRAFYEEFMGIEVVMERDEIITFASPNNPTAQISVIRRDKPDVPHPDVSIEVAEVDTMHTKAEEQQIEIVYPLTDEPWGVRRFFVRDPNGLVINILSHKNF